MRVLWRTWDVSGYVRDVVVSGKWRVASERQRGDVAREVTFREIIETVCVADNFI